MRNRGKFSKLMWLLLVVAFAAMAGGGCGGGSSSRGWSKSAEGLLDGGGLEAGAAGLMEIFTIPGLETVIEAKLGKSGFVDGQEIRSLPSMVYRSGFGGLSSGPAAAAESDEEDEFKPVSADVYRLVGLMANVRYTVEISENRAEPLEFMPVIQVRKWGDKGTETRIDSDISGVEDYSVGTHPISDFDGKSEIEIKTMLKQDGFDDEEAGEMAAVIAKGKTDPTPVYAVTISDPHLEFDLSAYPQEDPGIIAVTFVAPSDGDYELSISGMEDEDYLLCVYVERGDETTGYGYPEVIRYEDGSLFTVDDQIMLRLAVLEFNLYQEFDLSSDRINSDKYLDLYNDFYGDPSDCLDKYGLPDPEKILAKGVRAADHDDEGERPTPSGAYEKAADRLRPSGGQRSSIPGIINDIRRISKIPMKMGDTFDGVTGLLKVSYNASSEQRAVDFNDESWDQDKKMLSPNSKSRVKLITTERENEEEMEVTTEAGIALAKFSIENKNRVSKSIKYGLNTATLLLKYVICDAEYRTPTGSFTLSEHAAGYLDQNGASEFRKEFGDYYVSGVRYGGRFEAIITITTTTREEMKEIENAVNTTILAFNASNEFKKNLRNALKNSTIEINIYEEGGSASDSDLPPVAGSDNDSIINGMMDRFNAFINASKGDGFQTVPVFYQLTRLRALNRESIDEQIDVAPNALLASRKLLRTMMGVDAYYNVLNAIPDTSLRNGVPQKDSWTRLHDKNVITEAQLHEIFTSVPRMDEKRTELEKIRDDFRVMTERWSFYKALMAAQKSFRFADYADASEKDGSRHNTKTWKWGLQDFSYSSAVHKNYLTAEKPEIFKAPPRFCWRHDWYPQHDRAGIVAYHWITDYCECNHIKNQAPNPTIGSHTVHWWFRGMGTQSVNWTWGARWFDMKPAEFPFRGLDG